MCSKDFLRKKSFEWKKLMCPFMWSLPLWRFFSLEKCIKFFIKKAADRGELHVFFDDQLLFMPCFVLEREL